ncbi:YraN family protein [Hirschia litorea]|uniref:UPF0102 protein ACFQS8_12210 n=1 Tax=Hirschia litorea TaxID=1199156 RepID=A0ABW2IML2_9PROT
MKTRNKDTSRQKRETKGRRAELLASLFLMIKGYQILAHRVRMHSGEIDIIAKKGALIAFIEVKARKSIERGQHAVTDRSWRRIARTAEIWMSHKPNFSKCDWRYDLLVIAPFALPKHFQDYWRL